MYFYSTNKKSPKVNFEQALMKGLAPDGGLYFPASFPKFTQKELNGLIDKSLIDVSFKVLQKWLKGTIDDQLLSKIIKRSLNFPIRIKRINDYQLLELSHGMTMAFKDIAVKCLAQIIEYFLEKNKKQITILVATSGDTGAAVAQGFSGAKLIRVVILYPKDKVSMLQEEQLTRVTNNIFPIEVNGVFDDCQTLVKKAFVDPSLDNLNLTSANSINIGRLIPQIIYYVYTYASLNKDNLEFIVPSGNMGNITAGLFAYKMGIPIKSFVIATNENDTVVKYYKTGVFKPQKTITTLSNAMDIGNPSNFIRILELFKYDHQKFKKIIKAIKIDDKTTIETIKKVYKNNKYLMDPHTAVAFAAAEKIANKTLTNVIISTASPLKFANEIKKATGIKVDDQKVIKALQKRKQKKYQLENNYNKLKKLLINLK